jgi:hypothetical protein
MIVVVFVLKLKDYSIKASPRLVPTALSKAPNVRQSPLN